MRIVEPIMGVAHWRGDVRVDAEEVTIELARGVPVSVNGKTFASTFECFTALNAIGGRHGFGMSDQIENRVIDAKSRGIYEAPAMALLHTVYERLLSAVHNENTTELYTSLGRRLGRLLYEGRWFDPEALMLKEALTRWVAPAVSGRVSLELRRGDDCTLLDTSATRSAYEPDKLSMERTASAFTPEDRVGALEMQSLGVLDNRELLLHFAKALGSTSPLGALLLGEGEG
jgi:argininosuccinate synthase